MSGAYALLTVRSGISRCGYCPTQSHKDKGNLTHSRYACQEKPPPPSMQQVTATYHCDQRQAMFPNDHIILERFVLKSKRPPLPWMSGAC